MPSTLTISCSVRMTAPVLASTYVASRLGVPLACTPPLITFHAKRGVASEASTTREEPSTLMFLMLRVAALLERLRVRGGAGDRGGHREAEVLVQREAAALPGAGLGLVDDQVAADDVEAAVGAVQPDVGGAVGVHDRVHGLERLVGWPRGSRRGGTSPPGSPGRSASSPRRQWLRSPRPASGRRQPSTPREPRYRRESRSSASGSFRRWARRILAIPRHHQPARQPGVRHQRARLHIVALQEHATVQECATKLTFRGRGTPPGPPSGRGGRRSGAGPAARPG